MTDSSTFHSNMDFYDKIIPEYLIQGAVIVASVVSHAAMRDEKLPRKPNTGSRVQPTKIRSNLPW